MSTQKLQYLKTRFQSYFHDYFRNAVLLNLLLTLSLIGSILYMLNNVINIELDKYDVVKVIMDEDYD